MLDGTMDVTVGVERHRLREGDCLAMDLDHPTMFHNPTRKQARRGGHRVRRRRQAMSTANWSVRRLHAVDDTWVRVGDIPGYALMPHGGLCSTTVFYRNV
jgi:hypothetical protein